MKKGIINISIALLLLVLSSVAALTIAGVMKEVLDISSRVEASLDSTVSRIFMMSSANIWAKFLTDNGGYWDSIHPEIPQARPSTLAIEGYYLKVNFGDFERTINYVINSHTVTQSKFDKYISVEFSIVKNGQKLPFGAVFDFGWPGF
ncbi:hypothetical protein [Fervidobacterium sp.]